MWSIGLKAGSGIRIKSGRIIEPKAITSAGLHAGRQTRKIAAGVGEQLDGLVGGRRFANNLHAFRLRRPDSEMNSFIVDDFGPNRQASAANHGVLPSARSTIKCGAAP